MADIAPSDMTLLRSITIDRFERIAGLVRDLTADLPHSVAIWRPDPDANSIDWLLWHLARVQDDHVAALAGSDQVWTTGGFYEQFALPFDRDAHGFGQSSDEVGAVQVSAELLAAYHAAVHTRCTSWAASLTVNDLDRVVDNSFDPPVTAAARLVSLTGDCLQHAGQAAYIRGMARRAGVG